MMDQGGNQPRSSKGIFDTSLNYTRSPGAGNFTSPKGYQQQSQINVNVNQREGSVYGGANNQSKQWNNPMFDPNMSQMSQKKIKVFDDEKHEDSMRTTHINPKFIFDAQTKNTMDKMTISKDSGNIPAPMRPTINSVMKLSQRQSNIPKERINIISPKDNRPLQPYFKDKRILVTGASSGIGRATAVWFLNAGARVALIGRDWDSLSKIGEEFPDQAMALKCDLTIDEQLYDMCNAVIKEWKGLDILVNSAGIFYEGDLQSMWPQDYDYLMDINIRSTFSTIQMFRPYIEQSKGVIVNVSCVAGSKPFAGMYAYCMSKAGIEALTKSLALELAKHGCRVNAVAPGFVDTNLLAYRDLDRAEIDTIYKNATRNTPLGRLATVEDVARTIVFLCSRISQHITGQVIKVDGARSLTSSGWVKWEGMTNMDEAMEQYRASYWKKIKNFFKEQKKSFVAPTTLKQIVEEKLKLTNWGTTDKNAHITISSTTYKNIHDDEDDDGGMLDNKKSTFTSKSIF